MATIKHTAVGTSAEVIPSAAIIAGSAQLSYTAASASTEYNNESGLNLYADFALACSSGTPSGSAYVGLYIIPEVDGTYPITPVAGTVSPGEGYLAAVFPLNNTATTGTNTIRSSVYNVPLPPQKFRTVIGNWSGMAFAGAGTLTVGIYPHNLDLA